MRPVDVLPGRRHLDARGRVVKTDRQRRQARINLWQILAYIHGCGRCLACRRRADAAVALLGPTERPT